MFLQRYTKSWFLCIFVLMIMAFILSSVEIYVLLALLAAAVLAFCMKPSRKGEAVTHMLAGTLCFIDDVPADSATIDFECLESGNVLLTRRGFTNLTQNSSVSIVINVIGFDVKIEERVVLGDNSGQAINAALFTLEFMAQERYHIHYISDLISSSASLTLNNRSEMHVSKKLKLSS